MNDLIVIGAGVSGMSLAHFCAAAGLDVMVLEKAPTLGGCLHSWRPHQGYWVELGAHTCYNSYTTFLAMLEQLGETDEIISRAKVPFRLLVDGQLRSIVKELSLAELAVRLPRLAYARNAGKTVRSYYEPLVGPSNYAHVLGPMLTGMQVQPADLLAADMLFKKRQRRRDVQRSFTFKGGLSSVIDAIARQPRITTRTQAQATSIVRDSNGLAVQLGDGTHVTGRFVALAVPSSAGASLIRDYAPDVAMALARVETTTIETTGMVLPRNASPLPPVAGIIPVNGEFYSMVSRDTVSDEHHRGFALHTAPGTTDPLAIAARVLGVETTSFLHTTRRQSILPSARPGHDQIVAGLDAALAELPLFVTGNFFRGLAIEDCVIRSLAETKRLLAAEARKR